MMTFRYLIFCLFCSVLSCNSTASSTPPRQQMMKEGRSLQPYVKKIEESHDSVSFIANFGHPVADWEWQTVFFVNGWFQCVYAQKVNHNSGKLVLVGEAKIHVNEIIKHEGRKTSYGKQRILKGEELKNFVLSEFDVTTIGFSLVEKKGEPPSVELMKYWHRLYP